MCEALLGLLVGTRRLAAPAPVRRVQSSKVLNCSPRVHERQAGERAAALAHDVLHQDDEARGRGLVFRHAPGHEVACRDFEVVRHTWQHVAYEGDLGGKLRR